MSDNSLIEWCTATWNFLIGCTKKSAGCMHCYAIRVAWRMMHNPNPKVAKKFAGTVKRGSNGELNWTGRINFDEDVLSQPLKWRLPRRIFVNSLSDFFHPNVKDEWIDAAFGVMARCPQHTFQVLTKHPERAVEYFKSWMTSTGTRERILNICEHAQIAPVNLKKNWPLPNVQIIASVEDQPTANERIPWLLEIPAAVRGLSVEPLLGPISLAQYHKEEGHGTYSTWLDYLDWVIVGGESGPDARPMHPTWTRNLRNQCVSAGVPFFFKQHGAWIEAEPELSHGIIVKPDGERIGCSYASPAELKALRASGAVLMSHVGKKAAGRLLDGRTWDEFPKAIGA